MLGLEADIQASGGRGGVNGTAGAAVINGQASGEIDPQQASWIVSLAGLGLYLLAVLSLAVNGALLARDVLRGGHAREM